MQSINEIMINKGDTVLCIETLKVGGIMYFIEGQEYKSPENNCLYSLQDEVFIQQQYLKHFVFKIK